MGFYRELRKSLQNAKRKAQVENIHEAKSINVCRDGGLTRSSVEAFVMRVERRGLAILGML